MGTTMEPSDSGDISESWRQVEKEGLMTSVENLTRESRRKAPPRGLECDATSARLSKIRAI